MPPKRILILGGTHEARDLAALLLEAGFEVVTSLAGVTENPAMPAGDVRRGGFGGAEGLARYLQSENIAALADATHPFAAQISHHADQAARDAGVPCFSLVRPAWEAQPGDRWSMASSSYDAARMMPPRSRPLVTVGKKDIGVFFARTDVVGLARMIEPPAEVVPGNWTLLLQRGPFSLQHETNLIAAHAISHVVAKNSGGEDTSAKLAAARACGLPVILIERPSKPRTPFYVTAGELAARLGELLSP